MLNDYFSHISRMTRIGSLLLLGTVAVLTMGVQSAAAQLNGPGDYANSLSDAHARIRAISGSEYGFASRTDVSAASLWYTIDKDASLYYPTDSTKKYLRLRFGEPLEVIEATERWSRVRTLDGANGLIRSAQISNVWIRISKSEQMLYVYHGASLASKYPTDLGYNFFADKERRGSEAIPDEWRTPEGEFFVVSKNPQSEFYRALVLNYPNSEDASRGKKEGLISETEFDKIVSAQRERSVPPMNTALGGWIEIHGNGTGGQNNWTRGCIAILDEQIDRLWSIVEVGTPVLIEP